MPDAAQVIRDNLAEVRDRIAESAIAAGREPAEVTLVGVTKYVDEATATLLADAGCHELGESRPQQLWAKAEFPPLAVYPIRWHQIGHLQRNKVKRTVELGALIHSMDSYRSLATVNKAAEQAGVTAEVLLEVNCSGDPEKHGVPPEQLRQDIEELDFFRNVRVRGLMTMAARDGGPKIARKNFALLRRLRDDYAGLAPEGTAITELSMGMSGDFEAAIAEGATIVRVGSALWEGI
ncbi:MAG: YggS family pyridoxal phosphate-dependent enzyme [Planctomycetota bacterium]